MTEEEIIASLMMRKIVQARIDEADGDFYMELDDGRVIKVGAGWSGTRLRQHVMQVI